MEAAKRERKALRTAFTKAHTGFQNKLGGNYSKEDRLVSFRFLETKMADLDAVHARYNKFLFESDLTDEEIFSELETDDTYKTNFLTAKLRAASLDSELAEPLRSVSTMANRKTMKLPSIELPKFSGYIKDWLPFWSQFKKINDDATISGEDKYQYLIQATVPGSKAYEIVNSFPPTRENYQKAIETLKNRFGRDDLLVEFYVRELLGLVLQNALKSSKQPASLSSLYDRLESYIRSLDTLGVTKDKCTAMLFPLVESSLPEDILRAWQRSGQRGSTVGEGQGASAEEEDGQRKSNDRLTKLLEFLRFEVENEERIDLALTGFGLSSESEVLKKSKGKVDSIKDVPSANVLLVAKSERRLMCIFCRSEHESKNCETARKLKLDERRDIIKKQNACFICLIRGHPAKKCRSQVKCDWCSRRHVLLMCSDLCRNNYPDSREREYNSNSIEKSGNEKVLTTLSDFPSVCLQTLRIELYSQSRKRYVRAVIDTCSHRSYIRTEIARDLQYIPIDKIEIRHSMFGGLKSDCKQVDVFLIRMRNLDNTFSCNFSALDQDVICDTISSVKSDIWVEELRKNNIVLSDIDNDSSNIDVLIGADVAGKLMTGKKFSLKNGLTAFETYLGWTVMGKLPEGSKREDSTTMITTLLVREAGVTDLWDLDVIGIKDPIEKLEKAKKDDKVWEFLTRTAKMTQDGRYEVRLPWVEDHITVPSNFEIACSRLKGSILKLKKQNLYEAYNDIFREWLAENIIEIVPEKEINNISHYLPHRPVIKSEGTTKIRPVFDASACAKGFPSLNHCLERGPNLMEQVTSSLNRFREGEIGVVSDIRKAFLQIAVNRNDRDYLRFLWMEGDKMIMFRHCRVVFGLACSPFLLSAILALLLTSASEKVERGLDCEWSRETVDKLKNGFYVDNCVVSVESEEKRTKFIREATSILAAGGFDLRGWESSGVFEDRESSLVLGVRWNKKRDTISVNPAVLDVEDMRCITKRKILSATHKIYDPFGVTSPVSLVPKLLIRKLWDNKLGWDTELTDGYEEFLRWLKELSILKQVEIPRKLGRGDLTLHIFGDASGLAYASVVFARVEYEGTVMVHLLNAKSRVAPKNATIPRLELMAATISVRLAATVAQSLTRPILSMTFWTDSSTVLAWIKRDIQWNTFVWNRVNEIRSSSKREDWKFISGELNPADLPSRGCCASKLVESKWWSGPKWLYKTESEWPTGNVEMIEEEIRGEIKKGPVVQMVNIEKFEFEVGKHFSSYKGLLRFLAWMNRFFQNRRKILAEKKDKNSGKSDRAPYLSVNKQKELALTLEEIKSAEIKLLSFLQEQMFTGKNGDKLSSFKTFLNEDGLRVLKTKIFNRIDNFQFRCPILLDGKNEITHLLVRETHERFGHAGTLMIMNILREKFWITSLRKIVRSVLSKCTVCKKHHTKPLDCEPSPLPVDRVRDAAVFEVVGLDFAGPLFIKGGGKAWICVFTCAVYRAVHFELATSLSVDGFLECLRRFIARRGRPQDIFSDNGTNFVGTNNAFGKLDWQKIARQSEVTRIKWHFNPPSAPWWGGWWERLIGVTKRILRKVLGRASLSYEGLYTVLCDAEAIVNSRPLTYMSNDPEELIPLSPSVFLQEVREIGVADCDMLDHTKLNKKYRYRLKVLKDLRTRFRTEYLGQLVIKNKKKETRKIEPGDIVLIGDDLHRRLDWPLARVMEIFPGRDGNARVALLKTKDGLLKRAFQRIFPLELPQNDVLSKQILTKMTNSEKNENCKLEEVKIRKNCNLEENKVKDNFKLKSVCENKDPDVIVTRSGRRSNKPKFYMSK